MYQAYLLLKPDNDFSFEEAQRQLAKKFPTAEFTSAPGSLQMDTDDWGLAMQLNEGDDVLVESRQLAEEITGIADDQGIATCSRRVEFGSDVPDYDLRHFDKFQRVLEALRTFNGTVLVDPQEPCVL